MAAGEQSNQELAQEVADQLRMKVPMNDLSANVRIHLTNGTVIEIENKDNLPEEAFVHVIQAWCQDLSQYSQAEQEDLVRMLASFYQVKTDQVL